MTESIAIYNAPTESLTVGDIKKQVSTIQELMRDIMHEGEHYGTIPGTPKPTLYKGGAEKLCLIFRLDPEYDSIQTYNESHLTVKSKCTLYHIASGNRIASGEGMCSTREKKYAFRESSRKCPQCGKEAIINGKAEYGGGYICFGKKGGCGAKFKTGDPAIEGQRTGLIENEFIADQYNTVLKMANKRSLIAAVLNATAASDIFTQDLEDDSALTANQHEAEKKSTSSKATSNSRTDSKQSEIAESNKHSSEFKALKDEMEKQPDKLGLAVWWERNHEEIKKLVVYEQQELTKIKDVLKGRLVSIDDGKGEKPESGEMKFLRSAVSNAKNRKDLETLLKKTAQFFEGDKIDEPQSAIILELLDKKADELNIARLQRAD